MPYSQRVVLATWAGLSASTSAAANRAALQAAMPLVHTSVLPVTWPLAMPARIWSSE